MRPAALLWIGDDVSGNRFVVAHPAHLRRSILSLGAVASFADHVNSYVDGLRPLARITPPKTPWRTAPSAPPAAAPRRRRPHLAPNRTSAARSGARPRPGTTRRPAAGSG